MFRLWVLFHLRKTRWRIKLSKDNHVVIFYMTPWYRKVLFRVFEGYTIVRSGTLTFSETHKKIELIKFFGWK